MMLPQPTNMPQPPAGFLRSRMNATPAPGWQLPGAPVPINEWGSEPKRTDTERIAEAEERIAEALEQVVALMEQRERGYEVKA